MELRHLRYFVAVAECASFRRAAERLHIAQPALSRQVKALESELGVILFERLPRRVALSNAGQGFLDDARRILGDVRHASERARNISRGRIGMLRVGFSEASSGHAAVTETVRAFRASEPKVELVMVPMSSGLQHDALRDAHIDAGFVYCVGSEGSDLRWLGIADEDVMLAMPRKHPLARRAEVPPAALRDLPLLCSGRQGNAEFFDAVAAGFRLCGIEPQIIEEANSSVVLSLVAIGMGLGIVNSSTRWRAPDGIVLRRVRGLSVPFRLDLIWRRNNKSRLLHQFIDCATAGLAVPAPRKVAARVSA